MKIIWIDGTFGIGKSAVAAAIVEEIPQAHLLEFDALQEKYKPTSVSDYFGKRYPEAKKYLVDALVDEITEIIQEGSCDCLVIPVALINDYCNQKLIDGFANIESHHFILTAKKEILHQRINNQENRARIAPIYDLDCCCEVGTLRKNVRTTSDGSKYNIEGFFKDFGKYRWFNMYTKEIIEDFDINKAIKNSKSETGIDIPQEVKEYYKTFFGERYYELKSAYQEYLEKGTKEEKEENQAR